MAAPTSIYTFLLSFFLSFLADILPLQLTARVHIWRVSGKLKTGKSWLGGPGVQTVYDKNEPGHVVGRSGICSEAPASSASLVLIGLLVARQVGTCGFFHRPVFKEGLNCTCITESCVYEGMEYMLDGI